MARRRKPQDPTYALIEQMVEKSGLNATNFCVDVLFSPYYI